MTQRFTIHYDGQATETVASWADVIDRAMLSGWRAWCVQRLYDTTGRLTGSVEIPAQYIRDDYQERGR